MHHEFNLRRAGRIRPRAARQPRRPMMRKLLLASICGVMLTLAGMALAASEANMVTGVVQKVDQRSGRVVIDGQSFIVKDSGPLALVPQVGHRVTLFYEERNGEKVITRLGQAGG
jgi:hypothetical protein